MILWLHGWSKAILLLHDISGQNWIWRLCSRLLNILNQLILQLIYLLLLSRSILPRRICLLYLILFLNLGLIINLNLAESTGSWCRSQARMVYQISRPSTIPIIGFWKRWKIRRKWVLHRLILVLQILKMGIVIIGGIRSPIL